MGFSLTRFSPIPTIGDAAPQTPVGSRTTTPVLTSTPQPSGRSRLHSSDPTTKKHIQQGNVQNSFTGVIGQVELQIQQDHNQSWEVQVQVVQDVHVIQQYFTQVKFLSETKELVHHQSLQKLQETCPSNNIWAKEVRKKVLKKIKSTHNHDQAPAMMAPVQHMYSNLGTQVQVDHTYNAQLVVEMITSERIVAKITSAQNVGQGHILHKCIEHLQTQVKVIIFALLW